MHSLQTRCARQLLAAGNSSPQQIDHPLTFSELSACRRQRMVDPLEMEMQAMLLRLTQAHHRTASVTVFCSLLVGPMSCCRSPHMSLLMSSQRASLPPSRHAPYMIRHTCVAVLHCIQDCLNMPLFIGMLQAWLMHACHVKKMLLCMVCKTTSCKLA